MAALIGHSASPAKEALAAGLGRNGSATTVDVDDIDFETEAETRGMHLLSCTRVSKVRRDSLSCFCSRYNYSVVPTDLQQTFLQSVTCTRIIRVAIISKLSVRRILRPSQVQVYL